MTGPGGNSTRVAVTDALGWVALLWFIGFALGVAAFPFVAPAYIGLVVLPILVPVTIWAVHRRFKGRGVPLPYYAVVGALWLLLAVALDYAVIVRGFQAPNYYDADIFVYYAAMFVIPLIGGRQWGGPAKAPS